MTIKRKKRCLRRKIKRYEQAFAKIHEQTSVYYNDTRNIRITNIIESQVPRLKI